MTMEGLRRNFVGHLIENSLKGGVTPCYLHYKTNSRIIRRIIRFGLVVEYHPDYQVNYQPDYRPGSTEVPAW